MDSDRPLRWITAVIIGVAVLAVDPSSPVTGGSILGDKTRMERLAQEPFNLG